ncbi:MAG: hypothetical protein IPL23_24190 [Saprospiraceae bacterium]|nr:hypothetical protein [Saprospiraceae bacterium]
MLKTIVGSRAGGSLIEISETPLKNLFDKYYFNSPSPRVFPMKKAHEWLQNEMIKGVDLVEFYINKDDDVLGWGKVLGKRVIGMILYNFRNQPFHFYLYFYINAV